MPERLDGKSVRDALDEKFAQHPPRNPLPRWFAPSITVLLVASLLSVGGYELSSHWSSLHKSDAGNNEAQVVGGVAQALAGGPQSLPQGVRLPADVPRQYSIPDWIPLDSVSSCADTSDSNSEVTSLVSDGCIAFGSTATNSVVAKYVASVGAAISIRPIRYLGSAISTQLRRRGWQVAVESSQAEGAYRITGYGWQGQYFLNEISYELLPAQVTTVEIDVLLAPCEATCPS